jgi:hypothetical protein
MKTYFDIGDLRLESRELALQQIARWKATNITSLSVREIQNTEVTRKSAKGNIIKETVRGSLERVPRIISTRNLGPTYIIVAEKPFPLPEWAYISPTHFVTAADAEQERSRRQNEAERLAALTDADIKEVQVPTLADILERDADKIEALQETVAGTRNEWSQLGIRAAQSTASAIADIERQVATLKAEARERFGVQRAKEKFDAAVRALGEAIHYDEFADDASERLLEEHRCWPDSDCREDGECTYEPKPEEIEEYLLEHAEDFELPADAKAA